MVKIKPLAVQRVLGTLYILSGISKFFPQLESVKIVLEKASVANKNSILAIPSQWMSEHSIVVVWFVGCVMIVTGLVLLINRSWVKPALYGTLLMLVCFMTFLHRSQPMVLALDFPFVISAIYLLVKNDRQQ